jgi:thiol-disulfide isomerase/thioredoxin
MLIVIFTIIFFLAALLYWFDVLGEPEDTQTATKEGFIEKYTCGDSSNQLVLYYASWCPVCQQMYPEWEKFKTRTIPGLKISEVRCEDGNETMCMQKGVKGYPTIIMYLSGGKEIEYTGIRTDTAIYKFALQSMATGH